MRLPRLVVRILSKQEDFQGRKRRQFKSVEYKFAGGVYGFSLFYLVMKKRGNPFKIGFGELG